MYHIEITYSSTITSNGTLPLTSDYYYSDFGSTVYSDILFTINDNFYLKAIWRQLPYIHYDLFFNNNVIIVGRDSRLSYYNALE